jgi:hypothetical protein
METAIEAATALVRPSGWLVLLATSNTQASLQAAAGGEFAWSSAKPLPGGDDRILLLGQKS